MSDTSHHVATLKAALEARVAEPLLVELTNPTAPGAEEVDTTRLSAACGDAMALLEARTGVAFVAESAAQVMLAVELALALLYERAGAAEQAARHRSAAEPGIQALAKRAALAPRTSASRSAFDFAPPTWHGYRSQGGSGGSGGSDSPHGAT